MKDLLNNTHTHTTNSVKALKELFTIYKDLLNNNNHLTAVCPGQPG